MPTSSNSNRPRRPQPPPNYASRSMQWRLLMLVALLMLVLVAMERARDPQYYRWLWGEPQERPAIQYIEWPPQEQAPADSPGADPQRAPTTESPLETARNDAWRVALRQLTVEQRSELADALQRLRLGAPRTDLQDGRWNALVTSLASAWTDYVARAESVLASQPQEAEGDGQWGEVLAQLKREWQSEIHPALARLPDAEAADAAAFRTVFAPLQRALDEAALRQVRDNTVFQSSERNAWFRLVEQAQQDQAQPSAAPPPRDVTYLQLIDQPATYRGQRVQFRGVARAGYRTASTPNALGVEHYDVLWIKPQDGANAPITVYCLSLPRGFPPLADRQKSGAVTTLEQPVAIDGYFFKRCAYPSQQGVSIAPLVVTAEPRWYPEQNAAAVGLSAAELAVAIGGGLVLGLIGLASSFYFLRSAARPREPQPDESAIAQQLRDLEALQQRGS